MPMPRPERKRGSPTFVSYGYPLNEDAKREILERLGLSESHDQATFAILDTETWLGLYPKAVEAIDHAPRAADYKPTYSRLNRQTIALYKTLTDLNGWESDALELQGVKLDDLNLALAGLLDAITREIKTFDGIESRGQPMKGALCNVVTGLRSVFATYYQGGEDDRTCTGSAENLSEKENDELEFIELALSAASIPHPNNIRRLFSNRKKSIKPAAGKKAKKPKKRKKKGT